MKHNLYKVTFGTGEWQHVIAVGKREAIILTQAEQIKKGNNYEVEKVEELKWNGSNWEAQDA